MYAVELRDLTKRFGEVTALAGVDAFWATPWLGFAVLAFWIVVPLAVGYSRFATADL